jgi:beta-lactamase class D
MKRIYVTLFILAMFLPPLASIATDVFEDTTSRLLVVNATTDEVILKLGKGLDEQVSPYSTFKVCLSVAALDDGTLQSESAPVYQFQESYKSDYLPESHWQDTTPQMWLTNSVVWFSQQITTAMGRDRINPYLQKFQYGNQDTRGEGNEGLTNFWLGTSLKISVQEQVAFLKKLALRELPVSVESMDLTEKMLHLETLSNGYRFYGKTGGNKECGWFVGWARKEDQCYIFAMNILVHNNFAERGDFENYPSRRAKAYLRNLILKDFKS